MNKCKRVNYLGRFIIFLYIFIAASVFMYRHEGATDIDMIMNFDSVIFFQKVYIDEDKTK